MSSKRSQHCTGKRKTRQESREFLEAHHKISDEKLIATVQICFHCGREFPFKRSRKRCPCCEGLLRIKTVVLKTP